jgi:ABC-type molybdate transport system substrate-binding protein
MEYKFGAAVALSLFVSAAASAAEIKVLASGATKEVIDEVLPAFEKISEHRRWACGRCVHSTR